MDQQVLEVIKKEYCQFLHQHINFEQHFNVMEEIEKRFDQLIQDPQDKNFKNLLFCLKNYRMETYKKDFILDFSDAIKATHDHLLFDILIPENKKWQEISEKNNERYAENIQTITDPANRHMEGKNPLGPTFEATTFYYTLRENITGAINKLYSPCSAVKTIEKQGIFSGKKNQEIQETPQDDSINFII